MYFVITWRTCPNIANDLVKSHRRRRLMTLNHTVSIRKIPRSVRCYGRRFVECKSCGINKVKMKRANPAVLLYTDNCKNVDVAEKFSGYFRRRCQSVWRSSRWSSGIRSSGGGEKRRHWYLWNGLGSYLEDAETPFGKTSRSFTEYMICFSGCLLVSWQTIKYSLVLGNVILQKLHSS